MCATDDVGDKNSAFGSKYDLTRVETPLPDWVVVGESVLVRPYSYSGVIAYVGLTEFAPGNWIGVELDAPTGTDGNTCLNSIRALFNKTLSVAFYYRRQERWCC